MKNTYLFTLSIILFLVSNQASAQKTIGAGVGYGTQIESISIHVDGQYFINDQWAISPSFAYYLPKNTLGDLNFKWFEFNANANYYFAVDGDVKPYALAGLNFSFINFPVYDFGGIFGGTSELGNSTFTKVGLNIGIGADFILDGGVTPFGQLRYNLSSFDQLAIEAGVRFNF